MLAIVATWLLTLGGVWALWADSGVLMTLVYLLAMTIGAYLLLARIGLNPTLSRGLSVSLCVFGAAALWYLLRILVTEYDPAVEHHFREITGAVVPGFVLGAATAAAYATRLDVDPASYAAERRGTNFFLRVDALTLCAIAAYLISNLRIDILLISSDQLEGVETYQALGDALTLNLFTTYLISRMDARRGDDTSRGIMRYFGMPLIVFATLICGALVGSNKLLLISLLVAATIAIPPTWRWLADYPARGVLAVVVALTTLAGALFLSGGYDLIVELLAQTRLFDYGNVDSIFDTPSLASRSQVIAECASAQLEHAPLFGDLGVEYYSCGEGFYLHSILSIQTHLGLVGSVLFSATLLRGAWVLTTRPEYRSGWTPLIVILLVGLIAAFFTWLPFWYLLGFLACLPPGSPATRREARADSNAGASHAVV